MGGTGLGGEGQDLKDGEAILYDSARLCICQNPLSSEHKGVMDRREAGKASSFAWTSYLRQRPPKIRDVWTAVPPHGTLGATA